MSDVACWMLDVRCWMFDVGCSMLDVRCWMFDVGCSMLDVRCWMFDVGCFSAPPQTTPGGGSYVKHPAPDQLALALPWPPPRPEGISRCSRRCRAKPCKTGCGLPSASTALARRAWKRLTATAIARIHRPALSRVRHEFLPRNSRISSRSRRASAFTGSLASSSSSTASSSRCFRRNSRTASASSSPRFRSWISSTSPGGLAAHLPGGARQRRRVNRLRRWVQQQARHVKRPLLVLKDGPSALENQLPEAETPAQGIPLLDSLAVGSGLLCRSHISFSVFGRWLLPMAQANRLYSEWVSRLDPAESRRDTLSHSIGG
jgi:hypothetical protein